ncbi:MAG: DUF952 domain-containing protein [Pseudomonadota bacterium]
MQWVCKVLLTEEAVNLLHDKSFLGSADDLRDGYIHLSTPEQVAGTLRRHFSGRCGLLAALCPTDDLGSALKWEPSRDGALFPHLYGPLTLSNVKGLFPIPEIHDGWIVPSLA